jgi:hypothetical protein
LNSRFASKLPQSSSGERIMSPHQQSAASFAKRLLLLIILGAASIFVIKAIYVLGQTQSNGSSDERKFNVKEFKDMPLEVREVKNLQSKTWNKDLEIEVKNVSGKPIYFILAYLIFPDVPVPDGQAGVRLTFGKRENVLIKNVAGPDDPHLDPDETYVFTIDEGFRRGLEGQDPAFYKKLRLDVMLVSFGDGTGWEVGEPRDKRKKVSALVQPDRQEIIKHFLLRPDSRLT